MARTLRRAGQLAVSGRGDLLLAAVLAAWGVAYLAAGPVPGGQRWTGLSFVLPYCAALSGRRRWPLAAAVTASAALLIALPLGLAGLVDGWLGAPFVLTPFLFGYALGALAGPVTGLAGITALTAALLAANQGFNPIVVMITLGPWLAGRVVLSRRRLAEQLRARNEELLAGQELFAREAVRYERARIAAELHDIVAHCLSVMVVLASAGQRLPEGDRDGVAEALESVAEAAGQASGEIGRLAGLLGSAPQQPPGLPMVGELVRRTSAAGQAVTCRFTGSCERLDAVASQAGYRLVQEALTNALRHAPGSRVEVTVREQAGQVGVTIENTAPEDLGPPRGPGLERSGTGYGLTGMRRRVADCGGRLTAGPTAGGGWRVAAVLPAGAILTVGT